MDPELDSQYILQNYDDQSRFQNLEFTLINISDITLKYTVFSILDRVLAPKVNKKV